MEYVRPLNTYNAINLNAKKRLKVYFLGALLILVHASQITYFLL